MVYSLEFWQCAISSGHELLSRTRWIIPLCGGKPLHWVMGWANFSTQELGIFDSLPEIHSETWALPVYHSELFAL